MCPDAVHTPLGFTIIYQIYNLVGQGVTKYCSGCRTSVVGWCSN